VGFLRLVTGVINKNHKTKIIIMKDENQSSQVKTKNITLGAVISWAYGVLAIFAGINFIFKKPIIGILYFVSAIIVFPPIYKPIKDKLHISLSGGLRFVIVIILLSIIGTLLISDGMLVTNLNQRTSNVMDDIYQKVASDAVQQYRIAERQGDKIQICVQAGLVSATYLQAQDESSYRTWKDIEKAVCRQAGMPQY
jgi:hypothetical protein